MKPAMVVGASIVLHASRLAAQSGAGVAGACEEPAANRASEIGCYHVRSDTVATLPAGPIYWHIYEIREGLAAAESLARRPSRGAAVRSAVSSLGRSWLYAIAGPEWDAGTGARIARIGPFPIPASGPYVVRYMEAVFEPGMQTGVHTHSGPEAWYVVEGGQCLQTPDTTIVARAGQGALIRGGPAMRLSGVGTGRRRALVVVLHDAAHAWASAHGEWTPSGPCVDPR